eukprot:5074661-Prymnesium_polylepis.1
MIEVRVLHCLPAYAAHQQPPNVYIPGEIALQALEFGQTVRLYVSGFNPGAQTLAAEFVGQFNDKNVHIVEQPPLYLQPNHSPTLSRRRLRLRLNSTPTALPTSTAP